MEKVIFLFLAVVCFGLVSCFSGVDTVGRLSNVGSELRGVVLIPQRRSSFVVRFDKGLDPIAKRSKGTMVVENLSAKPVEVSIGSRYDIQENTKHDRWEVLNPGEKCVAYKGLAFSMSSAIRNHDGGVKLGVVIKTNEAILQASEPKVRASWSDFP